MPEFHCPERLTVKQATIIECGMFCGLVAAGVGLRLAFRDVPNFAPVAALALFAGYYFRSALTAVAVPLLVMAATDLVIGGYAWHMMAVVYGMLALPALLRSWVRRGFDLRTGEPKSCAKALAGLLSCSLASSVLFYIVTNFGAWLWFDMYDRTWAGLLECYVRALPFFRYTLAGDACFAFVLFGGYAWICSWQSAAQTANAPVPRDAIVS